MTNLPVLDVLTGEYAGQVAIILITQYGFTLVCGEVQVVVNGEIRAVPFRARKEDFAIIKNTQKDFLQPLINEININHDIKITYSPSDSTTHDGSSFLQR